MRPRTSHGTPETKAGRGDKPRRAEEEGSDRINRVVVAQDLFFSTPWSGEISSSNRKSDRVRKGGEKFLGSPNLC